MNCANETEPTMTVLELVAAAAEQLTEAGVAFGHGTNNAFDEAAWLVLWQLGLPLDTPLEQPSDAASGKTESIANQPVSGGKIQQLDALIKTRITSRQPAAYLTHEAWLMGVPFYIDQRAIVPRSLIAELLVNGAIDPWLSGTTQRMLDLCSGNGSLAVLAAMTYPDVTVDAADLSADALEVARINIDKHVLAGRIKLIESDGFARVPGRYDLILCNPPYVNAQSMAALPLEFKAEPGLALDGNRAGGNDGMDFIRSLLREAPAHMSDQAVLVLEIGNERVNFEAAFPTLEAVWLETSAGEDQVLLLTREALLACQLLQYTGSGSSPG
jgi:ribosomal protein L3 glutamine methyltransferase